jgi:uncharacterized RDD family membrane protein YckC
MDQNSGIVVASPGHRIAAIAVDAGLYIVTLGIGWAIWNLVTWTEGQTPAKKLLKIRVLNISTMTPARWGQMCIRQGLIPWAMSIFVLIPYYVWVFKGFNTTNVTFGIIAFAACVLIYLASHILDLVWLFGPRRRRLTDCWAGTIVVNEANFRG